MANCRTEADGSGSVWVAGYGAGEADDGGRSYYCYYLDEEVTFGDLDAGGYLAYRRLAAGEGYREGAPWFAKGRDLLAYRK